jgi:pimeloyl-ACP methyl ester carboxylesterase
MNAATTERTIDANGIELHAVELGDTDAPLVLFCHGFPELSYSWRHQLPALADAGYHAVAIDQRGYGRSTRPDPIDAYDIVHLTDDVIAVLDSYRADQAVVVGHDWGAPVVWNLAQRAPERVRAVVGMSVPFTPRGERPPTEVFKYMFGDNFFYILYFQEPGVADANLQRDPAETMRRMLCGIAGETSFDEQGDLVSPRDERGFVERLPAFKGLPPWLSQEELDHYVAEFTRTGFTGGLNWYRNFDRNWELSATYADRRVEQPALFIGGSRDPVINMIPPAVMEGWVTDLRDTVIVDGAGHWVQQERPDEVNAALLTFLRGL